MAYSESGTHSKLIDSLLKKSGWLESNIVRGYYFIDARKFKRYEKNTVKELDEDKYGKWVDLNRPGCVRALVNNFDGIVELSNEYSKLQREIYR